MATKTKMIILAIIVAVLLIGIGYASISATELTIGGNVTANADANNFKVYFTQDNTTTSSSKVAVSGTAEQTTATVNITGLTEKDAPEYAVLEIKNASTDISATVSVNADAGVDVANYFAIDAVMCAADGTALGSNPTVAPNGTTYVKVSATLLKTLVEEKTTTIDVTLSATPVEQ